MFTKKTLLLSALAVTAALGCYQLGNHYVAKQQYAERVENNKEKAEEEAREWAGSRDYLMKRMVNPQTGFIDPADVINARKKTAQAMADREGQLNWESLGPNNVGGRTRLLIIDKNNSNRLITAGVAGGVFTSTDGGNNWTDHPQNSRAVGTSPAFESQAFSCGTAAPNGDIYLGTGEGFYYVGGSGSNGNLGEGSAGVPGEGIYKSTDGGVSFQQLASTRPTNANDAEISWAAVNKIAVAPNGTVYAGHNRGFVKSTDGGNTWEVPTSIPVNTEGTDVVVASNGTIHAIIGSAYYRSTDNGDSFTLLSGTTPGKLPSSTTARRRLAVSPTDPNKVYAVLVKTNSCLLGIYKSDDGGDTWQSIGEGDAEYFEPMTNSALCQGDYDLAFAVDGGNPDRIFLGGVTLWSWTAEQGWLQIDNLAEDFSNPYYVHADKHDIVFDPNDAKKMYVVSDGGVFKTDNADATFPAFKAKNKNYNVTQFYSVAASLQGRVLGGTQDNGTRYVAFDGANSWLASNEVAGGDGGYAEISLINPNIMFGGRPEGELFRSANGGGAFVSVLDENIDCQPLVSGACSPDGNIDGGAEFVTPFSLWEDLNKFQSTGEIDAKLATGSNNGKIWVTLDPLNVGGVSTWKNVSTVTGGVSCVNFSKDGSYLWAGSQTGRVRRVTNLNATSPTASTVVTVAASRYVTSVIVGSTPNEVIVTLGNYGGDDNIYYSTNGISSSPTFESIQHNLPPMPVYDAVQLSTDPDKILAATEMGVWMYSKATETWTPENNSMGNVPVFRIREITMGQLGCPVIYIGTHGRGFYRCTQFADPNFCDTTLPEFTATTTVVGTDLQLTTYPNPITDIGTVQVSLPKASTASIEVYDITGKLVHTINMGKRNAGTYNLPLNLSQVSAGTYFVNLKTDYGKKVQKIVVQ